ncbi:hypothetical protein RKD48_003119 [Streptomyces ambofaciens]
MPAIVAWSGLVSPAALGAVCRLGQFHAAPRDQAVVVRAGREVVEEDAGITGQVGRIQLSRLDERRRLAFGDVRVKGFLAAEVRVDTLLARPGLLGDAVHAGAGDPVPGELLLGCGDDPPARGVGGLA